MTNSENFDSIGTRNGDANDHDGDEINDGVDLPAVVGSHGSEEDLGRSSRRNEIGQKDEGATVMQWLLALDMQVMGACPTDARLKPMLNSGAAANDKLLAHLTQYFEPSEEGILAMCLCMPLVSIQVGKVLKQGTERRVG